MQGEEWPEEVGLEEQLGEHLKDHGSNVEEQHPLVAAVAFTELCIRGDGRHECNDKGKVRKGKENGKNKQGKQ